MQDVLLLEKAQSALSQEKEELVGKVAALQVGGLAAACLLACLLGWLDGCMHAWQKEQMVSKVAALQVCACGSGWGGAAASFHGGCAGPNGAAARVVPQAVHMWSPAARRHHAPHHLGAGHTPCALMP